MKFVVASIFTLVLSWELAVSQIESSLPLRFPFALAERASLEVSPTNQKGIPELPYVIVASTGPESFSGLSKYPVLNNDGVVAFVGTIQGADEKTPQYVYGWTHEAEPTQQPRPMFLDREEFPLPTTEYISSHTFQSLAPSTSERPANESETV